MADARTLTQELGGKWHQRYGAAPCPACQPARRKDQNALTLSDGTDGRLLAHCKKGCAFKDIIVAAGVSGGSYTPPDPATVAQREREERAQVEKRSRQARQCWDEALPIRGTIAEQYLRGRGITCALPDTLRFHPDAWHGPTARRYPAMVALVEGDEGCAIHRTYLQPDAGKAALDGGAKLMLGAVAGCAVRLTHGPGPLLVGEGIESTLSAFILHGVSTVNAWAALSASGMAALRLPRVGRVGTVGTSQPLLIVAVDGEKVGRDAGHALAERAAGLGWRVSFFDPGDGADWNDRLIEKGQNHERA